MGSEMPETPERKQKNDGKDRRPGSKIGVQAAKFM